MIPLQRPPRLRPGDLIGVAALSGPSDPDRLDRGVRALCDLGYKVRVAPNATLRSSLLGLAGDEKERLDGYRDLLRDPEVKAIFFSRGGYGVTRLLDQLDPDEIGRSPKLHCGFSDLTALHAFLRTRCHLVSFHGPMVAAELASPLDSLTSSFFPSLLEGKGPPEVPVPDAEVIVGGTAQGPLIGGCLSVLVSLLGSRDEFDYDGSLLFLEDVGEEAYRIDRMLGTLQRAGRFDKLAGIMLGSFPRVTFGQEESPLRLMELFRERFARVSVPVIAGLPVGHQLPNVPLPIGVLATWDDGLRVLRFDEEVVI